LLIAQQDGKNHPVSIRVLPPAPRFDNLPILVNEGVTAQHYVLKGARLDLLAKLTAPDAVIELGNSSMAGTERDVVVRLTAHPAQTSAPLPIEAELQDRSAKISLPDAIQTTGPIPVIASSQLSIPPGIEIALRPSEFPAGYTLTAVLDVRNIDARSELRMACAEGVGAPAALHIGSKDAVSSLQRLSTDQLFLSYDTSGFPAGCTLQAWVDNGRAGRSQPFTLAHLIRVPRILSVTPLPGGAQVDAVPEALHPYQLIGDNLEMIGQIGWNPNLGVDVTTLPAAIPGQGQRETMTVPLPDPSTPTSFLYIWLRGETASRATTVSLAAAGNAPALSDSSSRSLH
jgi:hypothetical protein